MNRKKKDMEKRKGIDEGKLIELGNILFKERIRPQRLFLVGKKEYILIYKGFMSQGMNIEDYGAVVPRNLDRGEILDSFSKIEFFINEIINTKLLGANNIKSSLLDSLLEQIDLFSKIRILRDNWKLIGHGLFEKIMRTKEVRNVLAHEWQISNVIYKKQLLKTNFKLFQDDLKEIWKELIEVYDKIYPQNRRITDIKKQIEKIKKK